MPPANTRKRKSGEMEEDPAPAATPTGSPRKKMRITQSQKQALMDNLQLEITERARQLRAGYALQCADLRARIERRVNRIPLAVRKMTMAELIQQHQATKSKPARTQAPASKQFRTERVPGERPLPPLPQQQIVKAPSPARPAPQATPNRGKKRKSTIQIASDKENEHVVGVDNLPVMKNNKRAKAGQAAAPATRTASRAVKANSVLSPRSHNSRTLPRSPIKEHPMAPSSPAKSLIARPISPLKPVSPFKSAATAATSAISASVHGMIEQAKRGTAGRMTRTASKERPGATTTAARGKMLPPPRPEPRALSSPQRTTSQSSTHSASTDISTTSTSTTIVKPKRGRAAAASGKLAEQKSPGMARRGVTKAATAAKSALKRNPTTANKKVVVAEPVAGRRVLRKRT
ncbi:uncharacterized protein A1O9_01390 [Exophiala aquamarina CBS 119918]|uniref:Borealin N-terminal domain-containing protein n=1 Tax=Exophiala aquamarina CBS 119918 TaxID=1182545 RepID=A0A072PUJ4_9EURO|nr:uncharacterized protein A1O9_01390 [Exophiala aquamarina CBS 119918]KEF63412.1 hypothetical protein A1O9_01390 [Exophiala aquamarina CBS 119918]